MFIVDIMLNGVVSPSEECAAEMELEEILGGPWDDSAEDAQGRIHYVQYFFSLGEARTAAFLIRCAKLPVDVRLLGPDGTEQPAEAGDAAEEGGL